ncbi:hypothetical protein [Methylobacterium sp. 275MFSha3.1]|uniref:hypothetical protein n=1 Tax=Methylobacterium sp. 275MFSha3.1 TaxID=1502746 RepID=UPI0011153BE4|nr:hypothetical protein [Methylobacterium sp. 275MFSha3.1]
MFMPTYQLERQPMEHSAKVIKIDRVRAAREALKGSFPMGPTRDRLLMSLEWGYEAVVFEEHGLAVEFATDQPIQFLLQALGGGWSARPDEDRPGSWIFQRHISVEEAQAIIIG